MNLPFQTLLLVTKTQFAQWLPLVQTLHEYLLFVNLLSYIFLLFPRELL